MRSYFREKVGEALHFLVVYIRLFARPQVGDRLRHLGSGKQWERASKLAGLQPVKLLLQRGTRWGWDLCDLDVVLNGMLFW